MRLPIFFSVVVAIKKTGTDVPVLLSLFFILVFVQVLNSQPSPSFRQAFQYRL